MYSFKNDYSEGACDEIMNAMISANKVQSDGYGLDTVCEEAKCRIKKVIQMENCDIHFLVGGTQANLTVIASALRPFEAVIAVDSGHINVHETGSIEATGHKVVIAKGKNGKLVPEGIIEAVQLHTDEHMVKPKMVYISNATEIGTVYSLQELKELRSVCDKHNLLLFMDGARLGSALMSVDNDVTMKDIAELCDVFYIGGTKNGALFGEAVIITNNQLKTDFRFMIKQRGGMLAKGRLLGIQFNELFKDEIFYKLAKHANAMAQKMKEALQEAGFSFFVESSTNQIFPILSNNKINELSKKYDFMVWQKMSDSESAVRIVTSWATPESVVDEFITDLNN